MTATIYNSWPPEVPLPRVERVPEREKDRAVSRDVLAALIGSTFQQRS